MTIEEALEKGTLIDVREPYEFEMDHAKGAVNIPLGEIIEMAEEVNKMKKPVLLYCQSGNRSGQAEYFLKAKGVTEIYNIGGLYEVLQLQKQIRV